MCQNTFKYFDVESLTAQTINALYTSLQQETHILIVTTVGFFCFFLSIYRLSYTLKHYFICYANILLAVTQRFTNQQLEYQIIIVKRLRRIDVEATFERI